jgi:hypothetical protein
VPAWYTESFLSVHANRQCGLARGLAAIEAAIVNPTPANTCATPVVLHRRLQQFGPGERDLNVRQPPWLLVQAGSHPEDRATVLLRNRLR